MKLVRYGERGHKPGLVHSDGTIRDISGVIPDLAGEHLAAASLRRVADAARGDLPKASGNPRLGPCVARPGNFIAIGLNYVDHAKETGAHSGRTDPLQQGAELPLGPNDESSSRATRKRPIGRSSSASSSARAATTSTKQRSFDHVAGYRLAMTCRSASSSSSAAAMDQGQGLPDLRPARTVAGDAPTRSTTCRTSTCASTSTASACRPAARRR